MKKYILIGCTLLGMLSVLASCEKELMDYEGKDCLYFDVRRGAAHILPSMWAHQFYTDISFGTRVDNDVELSLKVMASGTIKEYDRPFRVIVNNDSTTAVSGADFDGLQDEYVIKAGESGTEVKFTVHRTKQMDGDTLQLQLQLLPNEHFALKYNIYGDYPGTYSATNHVAFSGNHDASIHNLFFYDVLSMPRGADGETTSGGWYGQDQNSPGTAGLFSNFSAKKFRLMMELTNTTVADYANKTVMPNPRAQAISQTVAVYLLEMAKSPDTVVLDEDGTMMYVSYVTNLGGSRAWAPRTKPEDYFK